MKLGKKPARPEAYKLRLADYLDTSKLPTPPRDFGHYGLVSRWGMLGNDRCGDCVIAGGLHETMVWSATQARAVAVSDDCAVANYTAITGYDPAQTAADGSNPTDDGTDVQVAAAWRVSNGLVDAAGAVHRVAAFVFVDPRRLLELKAAAYLFGAVGIGFDLPTSAIDQFERGMPWSPVPDAPSAGGHYVPVFGWRAGFAVGVTWGARQLISPRFLSQYADEAVAYLSTEMLNVENKSPEGVDLDALRADLAALEAQ